MTLEKGFISRLEKPLLQLLKLSNHAWIDYDKGADVAYVSFERPQHATDSELLDNGVIVRKRGKKIVGFTILNAGKLIYG
ncbi:MAG: DUF2283 domain-containing protein [Candidatus Micrarchaeota archaeon]|nr:DUF2283 domain-containing protein [Candidatus Micrarchaeota archaeon]